MRFLKLAGYVVLFILGLAFAVRNTQPVQLDYFVGRLDAPVSLVVIVALTAGALLGILVSLALTLRTRHQVSQLRRSLTAVEQELAHTRAISKDLP